MKKINLFLIGTLMMVFMINSVLSEIQFYQVKLDMGNGTMRDRASVLYTKDGLISNDYVLGNSPFETYVQYSFNVKSSNQLNPNNQIDYCNLKIWVWKHLEPMQTLVLEKNFTSAMPDTINAKYFFQLYDRDQAIIQQECYFINKTDYPFELSADMQFVQPTTECKSCQFYLWSKQEADISKAEIIGNNVVTISDYIQKLVVLNFEIIVILFWVLLILLLFIAVGLIFFGIYWLFLYLWRVVK